MTTGRTFAVLLIITVFLIVNSSNQKIAQSERVLASGSDFDIIILGTLQFSNREDFIITVQSGVLNGTNCSLNLQYGNGKLIFTATDNCTIRVSSPNVTTLFYGVTNATKTKISNTIYDSDILQNNIVMLKWMYSQPSMIDDFFMVGLGMFGVCMMIYGTTSTAKTFIDKGLSYELVKSCGWLMLWLLLGFMFLVAWIWPV